MESIMDSVAQYGFAGFCVVLLCIIVWLIKQLLEVIRANNAVIERNTEALVENGKGIRDSLSVVRHIHEEHMHK